MREIKFRIFNKRRKKMIYDTEMAMRNMIDNDFVSEDEHRYLMQYTGLKDKNGREIYEGDIIRIYNDEIDEEDSWIGEVSYHIGGFFSGDEDLLGNVHFRAKVIGNIYENPELLEGLK